MKIAIPLFKNRVAPHFGASSEVLLLEIKNASVKQEARWNLGAESPFDIARRLVDLGVEKVICGGIGRIYKDWLKEKGVAVEDNKRGEVKEIIKELLAK